MYVPAQSHEESVSVPVDFRPPVRAESIDLRTLVSHRTATQSVASMESVSEIFKNGPANFMAVLDGERLLGMCSRQETAALLGGRYGFSLWARKPIGEHLCKQETRIEVTMPIGDVLRAVFARPDKNFYDDVLLVDESGGFLGFIGTETLFKVQNALLLTNIRELEERDRVIRRKNEQMETDLRMATELQQALMPSTYPSFPSDPDGVTALRFYHRYLPASMMGGDFFHIARLSDDTAGICICDVMGHGVRAALITAMLRALIETHAAEAADPGRFLTELNNEFTRILKQTGTLVFATVLYCVINIRDRTPVLHAPVILRRYMCDEPRAKSGRSPLAKVPAGLRWALFPTHSLRRRKLNLRRAISFSFSLTALSRRRTRRAVTSALKVCGKVFGLILISPPSLSSKPLLVTFTSLPTRRS